MATVEITESLRCPPFSIEHSFLVSNEVIYEGDIPIDVDVRVGPADKDDVVQAICERANVDLSDVVYVGDSHSDTEAFEVVGTAVLFDPDNRLNEADIALADHVVTKRDLQNVLPFIADVDR